MFMNTFTKIAISTMLLISLFSAFCISLTYSIENREPVKHKKYALLVGGGTTNRDSFESFYKNIEYVSKALNKMGYFDEEINILFYGGKTPDHLIVESDATKKILIEELQHLESIMDLKDSLLIFRSGHGHINLTFEKHETFSKIQDGVEFGGLKCTGTKAVMNFPDGDLSYLEFEESLGKIKAKQIIVVLSQCFAGQFVDITMNLKNTVVISETGESGLAFNQTRKTIRWQHDVWPFVKCLFDGFLINSANGVRQSVSDAFIYMFNCNPHIEGTAYNIYEQLKGIRLRTIMDMLCGGETIK